MHLIKENMLVRQFPVTYMLSLLLGSMVYRLVFGPFVVPIFVSDLNIYSRMSHIVAHGYLQASTYA